MLRIFSSRYPHQLHIFPRRTYNGDMGGLDDWLKYDRDSDHFADKQYLAVARWLQNQSDLPTLNCRIQRELVRRRDVCGIKIQATVFILNRHCRVIKFCKAAKGWKCPWYLSNSGLGWFNSAPSALDVLPLVVLSRSKIFFGTIQRHALSSGWFTHAKVHKYAMSSRIPMVGRVEVD